MTKLAAVLFAGALSASFANATVLTYESSFGLQTTNFTGQSLVFPQFDTSLGTLNSVTLTFLATGTVDNTKHTEITTSGYLQNKGGSSSGLGFGIRTQFTIAGDADFSAINFRFVDGVFHYVLSDGTLAAYSGSDWNGVGAVPADSTRWTNQTAFLGDPGSDTQLTSSVVVNCGTCSRFTGAGNVTIGNIAASGNLFGSFPNSNINSVTTQAAGVADITYNYTAAVATPEPATMGLFGSALLGLVAFRKRLARKA